MDERFVVMSDRELHAKFFHALRRVIIAHKRPCDGCGKTIKSGDDCNFRETKHGIYALCKACFAKRKKEAP